MDVSPEDCTASVRADITAQTGGSVSAPVFCGNNIHSPVTINIKNIYEGTSCKSTSTGPDAGTPVASALTEENIVLCSQTHKSDLEKKCRTINEGISQPGSSTLLNKIYTELYVTEGGSGEVNNQHEIRQIEIKSKRRTAQETPINCNDIFKSSARKHNHIRTVLTRGVAGIGKTVSVQKFVLDWVEGKANQDFSFIFPLSFRELNLIKEKTLSLLDLLHHFFPNLKQFPLIDLINCADFKVMFILDGLDESRLPISLEKNTILSDVSEPASVNILLTNLIKGNLLPSAVFWITSRPAAAANQILLQYIDQVTEIRGFSDPQKEEYFRKRISDQSLAEQIITHVKSSRSLYIMCHIPVFCWIAATVLERVLGEAETAEIPKTLTQMFTHFLIFQIKHRDQKYRGKSDPDPQETKERVLALGKLAFQQLEKGNLIFYEEDLRECGIDVSEVSVYSGVCTQIFREEFGLHLEKVFSFVHLSVQEFLAALFAFHSFVSNNRNVLLRQDSGFLNFFRKTQSVFEFLRCAVDRALESENGHLDLFLRFLLGLSLESNQNPLRGILPQTQNLPQKTDQIVKHIKRKIRENPSPEKSINLFHCLNELNDHSLVQEVQTYLRKGEDSCLSGVKLSPVQWSALVFVLLNSEEELDEFDLSKYHSSEECLLRLLPVVKASRKAVLRCCNLTERGCAALASTFNSNSCLRELDLSNSELQDFGVKKLSAGLRNSHCKLQALRLCNCIKEEGCAALVKALKSNPSHLRELSLNYNKPGESGVEELSDLLQNSHCKLQKLHLEDCSITEERCASLLKALKSNPSHLRELNLNHNKPGESGAQGLSDLLKDSECRLEKLQLHDCSITEESCALLVNALKSNPSYLRELNLSWNKLIKSGVIELSDLLEDPQCKLKRLQLGGCGVTEDGCAALISAMKSNPSHLRELNLNYCKPGDSGVKELSHLLQNPHCKLHQLQLEGCSVTEEGCVSLISALKLNPSHLRELNLSLNKPGESGVKELSHLLQNPHCKLHKLQLWSCDLTERSCAALESALESALFSVCLTELDLSNNELQDSGVKTLSAGLKNPHCKLHTLRLWGCELTEESCAALASALSRNSSSLRELDLRNNKLGDSGAKELSAGLKSRHCKLEKLGLSNCSIRGDGCAALVRALNSNPSHLKELNLTLNRPGESAKKLLSDLLRNPHCKLEKLNL